MPTSQTQRIYEGLCSDGHTADVVPVKLILAPEGLRILEPEALQSLWAYEDITSVLDLKRGETSQIGHKAHPGVRLFIKDYVFAHDLMERAVHLSHEEKFRRRTLPMMLWVFFVLACWSFFFVLDLSPSRLLAGFLPDEARQAFGKKAEYALIGGHKACSAPTGRKALATLLQRLQPDHPKQALRVKIVKMPVANAFSLPGGEIIISQKLLDFVKSPEELAGVLAHEIGHGRKRHPEIAVIRSVGLLKGFRIVMGTRPLPDVGTIMLFHTPRYENEADSVALKLLQKAQINAAGFAAFLDRLLKQEEEYNRIWGTTGTRDRRNPIHLEYLASHYTSARRIALFEKAHISPTRPALKFGEWRALKAICGK